MEHRKNFAPPNLLHDRAPGLFVRLWADIKPERSGLGRDIIERYKAATTKQPAVRGLMKGDADMRALGGLVDALSVDNLLIERLSTYEIEYALKMQGAGAARKDIYPTPAEAIHAATISWMPLNMSIQTAERIAEHIQQEFYAGQSDSMADDLQRLSQKLDVVDKNLREARDGMIQPNHDAAPSLTDDPAASANHRETQAFLAVVFDDATRIVSDMRGVIEKLEKNQKPEPSASLANGAGLPGDSPKATVTNIACAPYTDHYKKRPGQPTGSRDGV